MSTEIKPGDTIVTIQDAPSLLGYPIPKGTHGTVIRSGPPIVGPYSVYARFEGDRPGDGRQVRPGDVVVVPATPAPLDPSADEALAASLQRLGKVWSEYREQQVRGAAKALDVVAASIQQVVDAANAVHQPAPEPELEWKPGTVAEGTVNGTIVRGLIGRDDNGTGDVFTYWNEFARHMSITGHVPDDVRPLVVIDPAAVDVDALVEVAHHDRVLYGDTTPDQMRRAILRILAHMGIEATS